MEKMVFGKSTLLKTLNGTIKPINGSFEFGYHVNLGYFDQQLDFDNLENTVFEEFSNKFPKLTTTEARTILGTFLFSGEDVFKKIKVLSGGEKARLKLCEIFKKEPNLLLLDEPTNHMDIIGKEALENILKEYKGTLIFVSHDRYFVNKIANKILEFKKGKVTFFDGNYKEFQEYKEKQEDDITKSNINNQSTDTKETRENKNSKNQYLLNKENNKRKNKMNKLEKEIEEKEAKIKSIEAEMKIEENFSDYEKLNELQNEINNLNEEIEQRMLEWESLNNLIEEI